MSGLLDRDFAARFRDRDTFRGVLNHLDVERQLKGRDAVNQALYIWAKTLLPNYILSNLGDRMEMAHSVEGRLPFLDHHLVEEVTRMPVAMKIQGMTEKYVLREATRPVLIDAVYRASEAPVSVAAVDAADGWTAVRAHPGHSARFGPRANRPLRQNEGQDAARRDPGHGSGDPHGPGCRPHVADEHVPHARPPRDVVLEAD